MADPILIVIAPKDFRDEELAEPKRILEQGGWQTKVASTKPGVAHGMLGATIKPELLLEQVQPADYAGLIIVGGAGSPEHLWGNITLHGIARAVAKEGKTVSAICLSPAVLAKAGLLQGRRATVYPSKDAIAALRQGGAILSDKPVEADGQFVTGNGPEAARAFGEAVLARLGRP